MSVTFSEKSRLFLLHAGSASYAIKLTDDGRLIHLHFGGAIGEAGAESLLITAGASSFSPEPKEPPYGGYSPDIALSEYSTEGCGDYRISALQIKGENGNPCTDLRYEGYRIVPGKYAIPGQPAVYGDENQADTLEIDLIDPLTKVRVTLFYGVFRDLPVITRAAKIVNCGDSPVELERVASLCLDLPMCGYDLITLWGTWAAERSVERRPLAHGLQGIHSKRGSSGHFSNPFAVLCDRQATEEAGEVYGVSLVYSSNHQIEVEVDSYGQTRLLAGINPENFGWHLEPGEEFHTPEAVAVYSDAGLGAMSRAFHKLYRHNLCRGPWKEKVRPVIINNWEGTYFDFDEEKLFQIAKSASELGVEMLVMDDGWFGHRNDDRSSLGDWYVNENKLRGGLPKLVERIRGLGMQFGIWFEPEMISPDSDLYRAHPDWCLHIPGRDRTEGRHQLVLDMSRADVRDYLFDCMAKILSSCPIDYVKWDFNRNLTEVGSALLPPHQQKEVAHRYVLGLYELLERLLTAFPHLLLEGCSGGGGRFDPAMLYYSPQIWTSDDTDALERIRIQYGTSMAYPSSAISAHVSAIPNHQTGRSESLITRGRVALAGTFGYELDLTRVSESDKEQMKRQIADYHKYAPLVQGGNYYRLISPFESDFAAWMWVSPDRKRTLMMFFVQKGKMRTSLFLKLRGLDPDGVYVNPETGERFSGALLMNGGINLCGYWRDADSRMWYLERESEL